MGEALIELTKEISPKKKDFSGRDEKTTDIWLTPRYVLEALGKFDLDPCAASNRPWPTAKNHYTVEDDGLSRPWTGRVWCNPPFGEGPVWIERLAQHGNGIALVGARVDTIWFHKLVWNSADGVFFKKGRIHFYQENGKLGNNPPFPPCLVAYGQSNAAVLRNLKTEKLNGRYVDLNQGET